MQCFHPIAAWQSPAGGIVFSQAPPGSKRLELPCGRCIGCRVNRTRQWATRCMHEAALHDSSWFVTLTYDDEHLPQYGSLHYPDFQKFMKRVRASQSTPVRFYMCGEYGDQLGRPHYHACMFGLELDDLNVIKRDGSISLYSSNKLQKLWPFGYVTIGPVTLESAAYVASYCQKKIVGKNAQSHYERVIPETGQIVDLVPEFSKMSLKPGIGADWLRRYKSDVFTRTKDRVIFQGGKGVKPPRYYDKILENEYPDEFIYIKELRKSKNYDKFLQDPDKFFYEDSSPRLAVKEQVEIARHSLKQRKL